MSTSKVSRREFLRMSALGTGALAIAACAAPAAAPAGATDSAAANAAATDLSFMTWWLPPLVLGTAVELAIDAFNENNPDLNVSIEPNPGGPDAQLQKWQTMLASGAPPDVSLMRPHYHTAFASRGAFLQVDDFLSAESSVQLDDFWPQTLERLSWDGKLWGLAAEIWFSFFFLNLDLFAEAGVDVPTSDWSWDDFLGIASQLTKGEGIERQYGAAALGSGWWHQMVWAWGGEVLDAEETTCLADQEPAPEAIQWTADLTLVHGVAPSPEDLTDQNETSLFETGRVAMFERANWYLSEADDKFGGNWTVVANPIGPGGRASVVQGANYAIFKATEHPEAAWKLLFDMSVGNGQQIILRETGNFPPIQTLATLDNLPNYKQEWIDVSLTSAEVARPNHFVPQYVEWWNAARKELEEVWVGRKTAAEATAAMCPEINEILAASS